MDLKSTYNKIAEDWYKDHNSDTWWQEGTEKFLSFLPKGASILDVGCGAGVKSRYLADKGFKVTGIDFAEKLIAIAKRESPPRKDNGITFEVIDIYDLPTYEKTFEAVFVQAVLLHIPRNRIVEVFSALKNKVKPGGFLYVAVKGKYQGGVKEEIRKENDYGYEYERFFSYFSMEEIENFFKNIDMEIVWKSAKNVGHTEWLQVVGEEKVI
jgi:SAM-dependent methyltransferase